MSNIQCFRSIKDSNYHRDVQQYFELHPRWNHVIDKVAVMLDEPISAIAFNTKDLYVNVDEIAKQDIKDLFTKDGKLARNRKLANAYHTQYQGIISEEGLEQYKELPLINFSYGLMRMRGQSLQGFADEEGIIYFKCDFDLAKGNENNVEPITHIEYEEKHLDILKKRKEAE